MSIASQNPDPIADDKVECPNCGEMVFAEDLLVWDFGRDPDTGFHDAGQGCIICLKK